MFTFNEFTWKYLNNKSFPRHRQLFKLFYYLDDHDYFLAPASTRFHSNTPGGLYTHSENVFKILTKLNNGIIDGVRYSDETILISAFLHDCHKCTDGYHHAQYLPETSQWHRDKLNQNYKWNDDQFALGSEIKSVLIAHRFLKLSSHEIQAIIYHSGTYSKMFEDIRGHIYPLTLLLHTADCIAANIIENKELTFPDIMED
jgi:23S rRNA maturation-related 3'-5' exoribonuclease YhaM